MGRWARTGMMEAQMTLSYFHGMTHPTRRAIFFSENNSVGEYLFVLPLWHETSFSIICVKTTHKKTTVSASWLCGYN